MSRPSVLAFDLFGTLFDWRGSLANEGRRLAGRLDPQPDWDAFAVAWSKGYAREVAQMTEWTNLDVLLRQAFEKISPKLRLETLTYDAQLALSGAWSRLEFWPDVCQGLLQLRTQFRLASLSNANRDMQDILVGYNAWFRQKVVVWDYLCSAEDSKCYKPCPAIYTTALRTMGSPEPSNVMMVAAHTFDLNAAHALGFRTDLIERPSEPGSSRSGLDHEADWIVPDIEALSNVLC